MSPLAKVFELDRKALNVSRAVVVAVDPVPVVIVLEVLDLQDYVITVVFGGAVRGAERPGRRLREPRGRMGTFAVIGALLTLLGFASRWRRLGARRRWPRSSVTLLSGLAVKFGVHRFVAGLLLNVWFSDRDHAAGRVQARGVSTNAWSQALAWLAGSALWIAFAGVVVVGARTQIAARAVSRDPGGHLAEETDAADRSCSR